MFADSSPIACGVISILQWRGCEFVLRVPQKDAADFPFLRLVVTADYTAWCAGFSVENI